LLIVALIFKKSSKNFEPRKYRTRLTAEQESCQKASEYKKTTKILFALSGIGRSKLYNNDKE
jgi:hypothetical protein